MSQIPRHCCGANADAGAGRESEETHSLHRQRLARPGAVDQEVADGSSWSRNAVRRQSLPVLFRHFPTIADVEAAVQFRLCLPGSGSKEQEHRQNKSVDIIGGRHEFCDRGCH